MDRGIIQMPIMVNKMAPIRLIVVEHIITTININGKFISFQLSDLFVALFLTFGDILKYWSKFKLNTKHVLEI